MEKEKLKVALKLVTWLICIDYLKRKWPKLDFEGNDEGKSSSLICILLMTGGHWYQGPDDQDMQDTQKTIPIDSTHVMKDPGLSKRSAEAKPSQNEKASKKNDKKKWIENMSADE